MMIECLMQTLNYVFVDVSKQRPGMQTTKMYDIMFKGNRQGFSVWNK